MKYVCNKDLNDIAVQSAKFDIHMKVIVYLVVMIFVYWYDYHVFIYGTE